MKERDEVNRQEGPNLNERAKARKSERQERLGDALRRNLQKRKQQQRQRKPGDGER